MCNSGPLTEWHLCTVYVDHVPVDTVTANYPITDAILTGLKPGQQVVVSVIYVTPGGRNTNWSNEMLYTPPTSTTAPIVANVVVPNTPQNPTLLKIKPPDAGDCNPVQYNITYQSVGSTDVKNLVIDAVKKAKFVTVTLRVNITGICDSKSTQEVTPLAQTVIHT